jgi:RHS repeat-associated protein
MYDSFGNRKTQTPSGTNIMAPVPQAQTLNYYPGQNRISNYGASGYDGAGNVIYDLIDHYLYDPEGRLCAVEYPSGQGTEYMLYLYDGEGRRVAKVSNPTFSCTLGTGYTLMETYLLGPSGEHVTELKGDGTFLRSNVYANGQLLATYTNNTTYFALNDWLGTKRVVTKYDGTVAQMCMNLPFGDELICSANDLNEQHFTGQIHDQESGNDYFNARYYSNSTGRFLSPDPLGGQLTNPQTLNRYAYAVNNPLTNVDPTGLYHCVWSETENGGATQQQCSDQGGESWSPDTGDLSAPSNTANFQIGTGGLNSGQQNSQSGPSDALDPNSAGGQLFGAQGLPYWTGANQLVTNGTIGFTAMYGGAFLWPQIAGGASAAANATGALGPAANRIFWSGAGYFGAQRAAQLEQGSTLESTLLGRVLENTQQALNLSYSTTKPIWDWASGAFARGAQGSVAMYEGLGGYTGQTWNNTESVILKARDIPITTVPF